MKQISIVLKHLKILQILNSSYDTIQNNLIKSVNDKITIYNDLIEQQFNSLIVNLHCCCACNHSYLIFSRLLFKSISNNLKILGILQNLLAIEI